MRCVVSLSFCDLLLCAASIISPSALPAKLVQFAVSMASEKGRICEQQRQAFVDCMFVHSRCVQSGEKPFKECMQAELDANTMHAECTKRFRAYMSCWHQIVHCEFINILLRNRWIQGQGLEDSIDAPTQTTHRR